MSAQDFNLLTNASGITIAGGGPFTSGFGNVNGMGIGTPGTNQTIYTPASGGGVLYTSPYNVQITGAAAKNPASVFAYVSTNFTHSAILRVYTCNSGCTSAAAFTPMSTNSASPTGIVPSPGLATNQTVTRWLGLFVSNQNGASAFTGTDSAVMTWKVYDDKGFVLKHTYTFTLNNPNENVQTALRLTLSTAPGGRTISAASDYSISYGNVNGLGISPGTGLTAVSASGGYIFSTPYNMNPAFSSFSSTTGTLKAHISTDFMHPTQFEMRDSSNGSSFAALSKASGSQTTLTSSATSGSAVTRYLGLFVANTNSGSIYTGTDSATITFTLVVP